MVRLPNVAMVGMLCALCMQCRAPGAQVPTVLADICTTEVSQIPFVQQQATRLALQPDQLARSLCSLGVVAAQYAAGAAPSATPAKVNSLMAADAGPTRAQRVEAIIRGLVENP
jgi:hypothetical protein